MCVFVCILNLWKQHGFPFAPDASVTAGRSRRLPSDWQPKDEEPVYVRCHHDLSIRSCHLKDETQNNWLFKLVRVSIVRYTVYYIVPKLAGLHTLFQYSPADCTFSLIINLCSFLMHLFHHLPDVNSGQYSLVTALHCDLQPSTFSLYSQWLLISMKLPLLLTLSQLSLKRQTKCPCSGEVVLSITHLSIHANCPLRFEEPQIKSLINHIKLVANHYWHQAHPQWMCSRSTNQINTLPTVYAYL